ncbi:MAG: hypothetical protein VKL39_07705 [Leptolyngbyaceae bacterium]|nr:hypothetical protein [Leptolyngbyaceae bacterium]
MFSLLFDPPAEMNLSVWAEGIVFVWRGSLLGRGAKLIECLGINSVKEPSHICSCDRRCNLPTFITNSVNFFGLIIQIDSRE